MSPGPGWRIEELAVLIAIKWQQEKRTAVVPAVEQATRWIAHLGGYTGMSSGGPPAP